MEVLEASPQTLQHKQKGRGGDERCQKDRQPSASWGKGISWEAGIAQSKGRQLLLRGLLNGGRQAGPTNLP